MGEESLEDILNAIISDAEALSTQMTVEDKAKLTKAGADIFAKELETEYKANHYRHRTTGKDPHLAESVMAQNANVEGMKNGSSTVGFSKDKAYIANFIENGTKFPMYTSKGRKYKHGGQVAINGDHAIENLRNDSKLKDKIVEAQAAVYKQIVDRRNR
ncbi:HK97 gp10 family phage protein [Weissella cibaria]|uniref:HK97 gp10 family phage protein n=1 Tax=Weissella cibaria TaxID=137591 RepID=A0A9Q8JHJ4_9LACO|nr:HK97 gp10 family phage protein [Weissella cibaria]TVV27051.1 HK97 gp10 family phage protein [Weissella cibaria]TVV40249.1 HK97 gp10 family phage protein [Weissella cibaria]